MREDTVEALGRLEGKVDVLNKNVERLMTKVDGHNDRLYAVEGESKMNGYKSGTIAGVGVAIFISVIKEKLGL